MSEAISCNLSIWVCVVKSRAVALEWNGDPASGPQPWHTALWDSCKSADVEVSTTGSHVHIKAKRFAVQCCTRCLHWLALDERASDSGGLQSPDPAPTRSFSWTLLRFYDTSILDPKMQTATEIHDTTYHNITRWQATAFLDRCEIGLRHRRTDR